MSTQRRSLFLMGGSIIHVLSFNSYTHFIIKSKSDLRYEYTLIFPPQGSEATEKTMKNSKTLK